VLRIRIRDPVLFWPLYSGSGAFLIPGSGIRDGKKSRSYHPGSYHFPELRNPFVLKYFNALMRIRIRDPGIFLTLDPGSGMGKIRIRDKHPGSATLLVWFCKTYRWPKMIKQNYTIKLTMINISGCWCEFHHCSWTNQGPASWSRQFGGHQNHQVIFFKIYNLVYCRKTWPHGSFHF
jgi:hypothetical protein